MGHHFYHIQFTSQIMTAKEIHHTHQKGGKNQKNYALTTNICPPSSFLYLENLSAKWIKATILF